MLLDNGKWAISSWGQLLNAVLKGDVCTFEPNLIAFFKLPRSSSLSVIVCFGSLLSCFEHGMSMFTCFCYLLTEVGSGWVAGVGKSVGVAFPWVHAKSSIVGRDFCRRMGFVVVGKFSERQPSMPVVVERVDVEPKMDLELLVDTFRLPIGLRVVGRRRSSFDPTGFVEACNELAYKLRSSIAGDGFWDAKVVYPMGNKDVSVVFRRECSLCGDENGLLGGFVNHNENGVKTVRSG